MAIKAKSFTVVLADPGELLIEVIKEVRGITGLGLKESKDLVEAAPRPLKVHVSKMKAGKIKRRLERAGATVQIEAV